MGLDQWVYINTNSTENQIMRWRKHPNLEGWMERLYKTKGGTELFNCQSVELNYDDLDNLEQAIKNNILPHTAGFFFGENSNASYKMQDKRFIRSAKKAIKEGHKVFYTSWW